MTASAQLNLPERYSASASSWHRSARSIPSSDGGVFFDQNIKTSHVS
jgi:hypothetical protein